MSSQTHTRRTLADAAAKLRSPWTLALVLPLLIGATLMLVREAAGVDAQAATFTGGVLLLAAAVVTYTDVREYRIPNWVTYSAFLWGITINAVATLTSNEVDSALGAVGLTESLFGAAALFLVLLMIFSFTGGGAGDVKLVAAIGALLGVGRGVDAVAAAIALAGITMVLIGVYRFGLIKMLDSAIRPIAWRLLPVYVDCPDSEHYRRMRSSVPLGPFFALGIVVALFDAGPAFQSYLHP